MTRDGWTLPNGALRDLRLKEYVTFDVYRHNTHNRQSVKHVIQGKIQQTDDHHFYNNGRASRLICLPILMLPARLTGRFSGSSARYNNTSVNHTERGRITKSKDHGD